MLAELKSCEQEKIEKQNKNTSTVINLFICQVIKTFLRLAVGHFTHFSESFHQEIKVISIIFFSFLLISHFTPSVS